MGVTVLGTRLLHALMEGAQRSSLRPGITHIRRRQLPYWQERGWQRAGGTYTGTYQTAHGSFLGRIEDRGYDNFRFYIVAPPPELERSSHWACFTPRGRNAYLVHMARRPKDVSSGILTIERLITEAFQS
jgi:hypothetical protein